MNDDALRAAFARQEVEELDVYALRNAIDTEAGRRRRRRSLALTGGLAVLVALAITVPLLLTRGTVPVVNLLPVLDSSAPADPPKPLNLLLLGEDKRGGMDSARADTITIVHVSASRKQVYLISLSRDLYVEIPGHGKDKINSAYYYGGPKLVMQVVSKLTGVPLDGAVALNYAAMRSIIDTLGGVEVCLKQKIVSTHTNAVFPAGCQTLTGFQADDLARQRQGMSAGGYDRDRNGQRILAGVAAKIRELDLITDPVKVSRLLSVKGVVVDGPTSAVKLVDQLRPAVSAPITGLGGPGFHSATVDGRAVETLPAEASTLFRAILADDVESFALAHPQWVTAMKG
ncbi:LCP family protein required for cell wall assembly [Allocatelliglobosispora scoriae]|uniref:LCP family protein required for cell wall assembly n=1 Tax=Allocatelliglobosispora scoriae TaxID=643052 RepID=A0A841BUQ5_9ACTN|nr:LCP family protein [Allocatelliglobosispora scoriae]MBB5870889.1 LCP family protein required for cell wall assembly [Allocatelliglobosispora scoriae]